MNPTIISLDIESYGACQHTADGTTLPPQTVFHPRRSIVTDHVSPSNLILTCSITYPTHDPRPISSNWDQQALANLQPDKTMVFQFSNRDHVRWLYQHINRADTIIGMNLQFDIQYLRQHPLLRLALDGTHTLIDLSVVAYLQNEMRPERSLKSLGPITGAYSYDRTIKDGRFPTPTSPAHVSYNAQDTHNTLLAIRELSRRIRRTRSASGGESLTGIAHYQDDKLSSFCVQHYSNAIWSAIRMSEAGIPMDLNHIRHLEQVLLRKCEYAHSVSVMRWSRPLQGEGAGKAKQQFMEEVADYALKYEPELMDHPLFQLTEKLKQVSVNDVNRMLLTHVLEPHADDPQVGEYLLGLKVLGIHIRCQKLVSSYTYPLLRHRRTKRADQSSRILEYGSWTANGSNAASKQPRTTEDASDGMQFGGLTRRQRRKRTPAQWLKRHRDKQLARQYPDFRRTYRRKKLALVTYSPKPVMGRTPWIPRSQAVDVGLAFPTWYVTPSQAKDDSGTEEGGTKQGRPTCKGPAAQTFPSIIKEAYVSRYPDGLIVGYDLSQIELRVPALLTGEPSLVGAYVGPDRTDLQTQRAVQVFGEGIFEDPDWREKYRQPGKHGNFTDLYRAGPSKFQETMLRKGNRVVSLEFAASVTNARAKLRPVLYRWQDDLIEDAHRLGRIALPFTGQSRWFMGGEKFDENEIVNMPIQTIAGNTLIAIQNRLHDLLPDMNESDPPFLMFLNVYDAVFFDVRDADVLTELDRIWAEAVDYVQEVGYWSMIEEHVGREVPIEYDRTIYSCRGRGPNDSGSLPTFSQLRC
jgi:hypothetical protein